MKVVLTVGLSVPLYERGNVIGYWTQRLRYSKIEEIVQQAYQGLKKAGFPSAELTIQNGQGFTILEYAPAVHQNEAVIHDLENVLFRTNLMQVGLEAAQLAVQGKSGFSQNFHPGKQSIQVIGFSHLNEGQGFQGLRWSILVQIPEKEALKQIGDITNTILFEMALGLLIVIPIGAIIGRKVVGRLKPFWEVVVKASEGDLIHRVPITTQDELGQMGGTLNHLLDQLNSLLLQTQNVAHSLSQASDQLPVFGCQVVEVSQSQRNQVTQVALSVEEVGSTAEDMARNTQGLASTATEVNESAVRGGKDCVLLYPRHGICS